MRAGAHARRKKARCGSRKSLERKPHAILRRLGTGRPLDGADRNRMERVFGADLRTVRIHTDRQAHAMAGEFGAEAFTVGQHIAFAPGRFRPGTRVGDALLAHELAHTLQQKDSRDVRADVSGRSTTGLEKDANRSARYAVKALYRPGGARPGEAMPRMKTGTHLALSGCGSQAGSFCGVNGRFTDIPSGNVTPRMEGKRLGAPFVMEARFIPIGPGCDCHCGEYRQYIKGEFKGQGNVIPMTTCNNVTMSKSTYVEDGKTDGGTCYRYGYRNHAWKNSNFAEPDQATGCRFYGWDSPGIQGGPSGGSLELDLGFKGELVDVCNNKILATQEWTVKGTGRTP